MSIKIHRVFRDRRHSPYQNYSNRGDNFIGNQNERIFITKSVNPRVNNLRITASRHFKREYEEEESSQDYDIQDEVMFVAVVHNGGELSASVSQRTQIAELIVQLTENTEIIPTNILLGMYATKNQINPNIIPLLDDVGYHFGHLGLQQTIRVVPLAKGMCSWEVENVTKSEASFRREELLNCLHLEASVEKVFVLDSNVIITSQNKKNYLSQRVLEYIVGTQVKNKEAAIVVTESAMNDINDVIPDYLHSLQWNSLMPTVFKNKMAEKVEELLKENEESKKLWDSIKRADSTTESRALGLYIEAVLLQKALGYSKKGKHEVVIISENLKFKRFFGQNFNLIAELAGQYLGANILPAVISCKDLLPREPYSTGISFKDDRRCFRCCGVGHERKQCTLPDNWVFKFGSDCPGCSGKNHTIDQCPSNQAVRFCWNNVQYPSRNNNNYANHMEEEQQEEEEHFVDVAEEPQQMEEEFFARTTVPEYAKPRRNFARRVRN